MSDMLSPPRPKAPQTIRIDPDVWLALQQRAVPFVDTPNDVLRRLLGLGDQSGLNQTALVPVAARIEPLSKNKKTLFFVNTDAVSYRGHSYHDEWMARGIAVTSGRVLYREKLGAIGCGDTLLMYVNGIGVVAAGTTLDEQARVVEDKNSLVCKDNEREYHRRVEWHTDLRSTPISPASIKDVCGQTPRHTIQRVRNGEDRLRRLLHEA
jgi:hypothetical protein